MKFENKAKSAFTENGFTLLEALIAIAILSVGLLALARLQIEATQGNAFAFDMTEATNCATLTIDDFLNSDYDDPRFDDTNGNGLTNDLTEEGAAADYSATCANENSSINYTMYWNVAENEPITGSKTINVIIKWRMKSLDKTASFRYVRANI
jgi:prepilin-type N-terminal cleavage/methylation domain-containing protein